jgi:hypothetical protein
MTPRRSGELPPDAAARLRAAASIADPRERQRAIDRASAWARETYPETHKTERANMKVTILTRIAFCTSLWTAESYEGGEPTHGLKGVVDPSDKATVKKLDDAIAAVAKEKWGAKADSVLSNMTKLGKKPDLFFVREPYKNRDGDTHNGFEDAYYISATSKTRPLIIDRDKSPLVAGDGKPYAGSFCNVQMEVWAQDNKFGRAIRAQLKGVQFVKDGDAFSGGAPANPDDFDDLGSQGEEDLV